MTPQRLALGTAQLGLEYGIANKLGLVPFPEAAAILERALAAGIDTLDTAVSYGISEQRLGEIGVANWNVVSKIPAVPEDCTDAVRWVEDTVWHSLRRLRVASLYGLLLHRPQQLSERFGAALWVALEGMKRAGLIRKIGISVYAPGELEMLSGHQPFDIVQAPLNILDRRMIESGWVGRLAKQNTELHIRSVFLQGLLLMRPAERPQRFERWGPLWRRWEEWLEENRLTPLQACLRFALSVPQISRVIVGVDSLKQLMDIIEAASGPLPVLPDALKTTDEDLLNPVRWKADE